MFSLHTSYSTLCILAVGMSGAPPAAALGPVRTGPNPNGIGGGGGGGGGTMVNTKLMESSTDEVSEIVLIRTHLIASSIATVSDSMTLVRAGKIMSLVVIIS